MSYTPVKPVGASDGLLSQALHYAIASSSGKHEDHEQVCELLSEGADPNRPDDKEYTPLMNAVLKGDVGLANVLLLAGADPNKASGKECPLHIAVRAHDTAMVAALLLGRANPDVYDVTGKTPLHLAVASDADNAIVVELLRAGADLFSITVHENTSMTPLMVACHSDAIKNIVVLARAEGQQIVKQAAACTKESVIPRVAAYLKERTGKDPEAERLGRELAAAIRAADDSARSQAKVG